jgi:hypothetical protein
MYRTRSIPAVSPVRSREEPLDRAAEKTLSAVMARRPEPGPPPARLRFVALLEKHRSALANSTTESRGPNRLLAEKMRVSPTRVGEFLREDWHLEVYAKNKKKIKAKDQIRKLVLGFATSVERSLCWLQSENGNDDFHDLNTEGIVLGYWPEAFAGAFNSADVKRAIRQGEEIAQKEFKKVTRIQVELWIPNWGPFGSISDVKESFHAHYGTAVFRAIDSLDTQITPAPKELPTVLTGLPLRDTRGNWAVGVGPYATLERRFRRMDFLTFPAIRYPLIGLLISREAKTAPPGIKFDFPTPNKRAEGSQSLLDRSFKYPRFVARSDDAGRKILYSMFTDEAEVKSHGIETLTDDGALEIAKTLLRELEKGPPTIAFVGDGMLAFELYGRLPLQDIDGNRIFVHVVSQEKQYAEFSFLSSIMFRQEDHDLKDLLEQSQKQLFRSQQRVAALLARFLHEIDKWVEDHRIFFKQERKWETPVFIYSRNEVAEYIDHCYSKSYRPAEIDKNLETVADSIFDDCWKEAPKIAGKKGLMHKEWVERLFQSSK